MSSLFREVIFEVMCREAQGHSDRRSYLRSVKGTDTVSNILEKSLKQIPHQVNPTESEVSTWAAETRH